MLLSASMEVIRVQNRDDMRAFIEFPYELYREDPYWVAPLRSDQRHLLDRAKHPFYQHAEMECFLVRSGNRICGRIAAILDRNHGPTGRIGSFGFYESLDSQPAADALFASARAWFAERGVTVLRGPMNPSINYECGLLVDGFETSPMVMTTYNPPYYARLFERAGMRKARDLYAYRLTRDDSAGVLLKLHRAAKRLPDPTLEIRTVDLSQYDRDVESVWRIYDSAWSENWGAVPMSLEEFRGLGRELRPLLVPKLTLIAERSGQPVGFGLIIPDINRALKHARGALFPLGLLKILYHKPRIRTLRVLTLGILKADRNTGLLGRLSWALLRNALDLGCTELECSWILEDNHAAIRGLEFLGATRYKTYRIYEANVSSEADRAVPSGACPLSV